MKGGQIEPPPGKTTLKKFSLVRVKNKTLTNGRTYWECAQRCSGNGCNVKITLDAPDRFVAQTHQHTYTADLEGNDLGKSRNKTICKRHSRKNAKHNHS